MILSNSHNVSWACKAAFVTAFVAFAACLGAGIYLIVRGEDNDFGIFALGIGWYFVGKAVFVGASLCLQALQFCGPSIPDGSQKERGEAAPQGSSRTNIESSATDLKGA